MDYQINDGYTEIIKLDPKPLFRYINIPDQLQAIGLNLYQIPSELPESLSEELAFVIRSKRFSVLDVCTAVSRFFQAATNYIKNTDDNLPSFNLKQNEVIRMIMNWTEENYGTEITLEQVAKQFHYNKQYFCSKFKRETNVNYWDYLHSVRIYHACSMLRSGMSINQTSEKCGYTSVSYFIQLFKNTMKVTPKQYLLSLQSY